MLISEVIQSIFDMLQLSKEKQFISGKAVFLLAQIAEKIRKQEKPSIEKEKLFMETSANPQVYLEPSLTSMMELLANIFGSFQPLTIFEKKTRPWSLPKVDIKKHNLRNPFVN